MSAAYCAVLASQNWFRSTTHTSNVGFTREEIHPVLLATVVSGAIVFLLALVCLWKARSLLERGSKVSEGKWIQSHLVMLYALPLLYYQQSSSTSVAADGSKTVVSGGYGHDLSWWLFCFAVAGLMLLQIAVRLYADKKAPDQSAEPSSGLRLAATHQ